MGLSILGGLLDFRDPGAGDLLSLSELLACSLGDVTVWNTDCYSRSSLLALSPTILNDSEHLLSPLSCIDLLVGHAHAHLLVSSYHQ